MGDQERRYLRSVRIKFGLILIAILSLAGFFVWQDWSEGQYYKLILVPLLAIAGGLRSMKAFRRPKPN